MFRKLRADEIDVRVGRVIKNRQGESAGVSLLLYKDARCDMAILDETVGAMSWQRSHSRDNRNCTVSLWDTEKGYWVSKEDTGTESSTEAEKGLASDSFKRACTCWGIGRELYTAPDITVWESNGGFTFKNGKCYDRFKVTNISYDDEGSIDGLVVANAETGARVFVWMTDERRNKGREERHEADAETSS